MSPRITQCHGVLHVKWPAHLRIRDSASCGRNPTDDTSSVDDCDEGATEGPGSSPAVPSGRVVTRTQDGASVSTYAWPVCQVGLGAPQDICDAASTLGGSAQVSHPPGSHLAGT